MGLVLALLLSFASQPALAKPSGVEAELIALERHSWAAWQGKDVAFWERHLSADHIELDGPNGPQGRDYVLQGVANRPCAIGHYRLGEFQFRRLGADAGMLVYRAEQEFVCGDKRTPNVGWVTSVYRRSKGRWTNILFEHLVVPPRKPTAPAKP